MRRLLNNEETEMLFTYMEERFGLARSIFAPFILERTKRDIWLMPKDVFDLDFTDFEIEKRGLRSFNGEKHPPKPTSTFLQRFGHLCTKGRVELSALELQSFLNGESLIGKAVGISQGYILVCRHSFPIGCGFVRDDNIETQFPLKTGRSISKQYL